MIPPLSAIAPLSAAQRDWLLANPLTDPALIADGAYTHHLTEAGGDLLTVVLAIDR